MIRSIKWLLVSLGLACATIAHATVPVINGYGRQSNEQEGQVIITDAAEASGSSTAATSPLKQRLSIVERQVSNLTQLLSQVNQLQTQLQELHGDMEVQKHALKELQDQVRSQYQDLDQRISAQAKLAASKATAKAATEDTAAAKEADSSDEDATKNSTATKKSAKATINTPADETADKAAGQKPPSEEEDKAYQAAVLLLKNKKYTQASTAFQKFIKQHPASQQTNNARFWLGQLYLLQGSPDRALEQFHIVLKKAPSDSKTPDILLQVGLAYYAKGDMNKAQAAFKKLLQKYPDSSAAKLAQARLKLIQQNATEQPDAAA